MAPLPDALHRFLVPRLDRRFLLRLTLLTLAAWGFFGWICRPMRIHGVSMEPNWRDGTLTFCWHPRFWRRAPRRGEPVTIRMAGTKVMFLKRVVALGGETVAFQDGTLQIDGQPVVEPHVVRPCSWQMAPRQVRTGYLYVVGDNREMAWEAHEQGEVQSARVVGGPLW